MEATPQIIILAIRAAEERAEAVELNALQRRCRAAAADADGIVGGDAIDLDCIEFVEAVALQQRQGGDVEIRKAEITQQDWPFYVPCQAGKGDGEPFLGALIERLQVHRRAEFVEQRPGIAAQLPDILAQMRIAVGALAFEIVGQARIDCVADRGEFGFGLIALQIGDAPREQAQATQAEAEIEGPQERDRRGARPAGKARCHVVEPARGHGGGDVRANPAPALRPRLAAGMMQQIGNRLDHAGDLQMAISGIAIASTFRRCRLRALPPRGQPCLRRRIEEQRIAKQRLDLLFDLGADAGNDRPHPLDLARAFGDLFQIVANRLLAGEFGNRADDRLKEAGGLGVGGAEVDRAAGVRIDIDEPPVDLAARGAFAQRLDRRSEGCIVEHRAIDQHCALGGVRGELARQDASEERRALRPGFLARREHAIELADHEGRESAGEARRRARGKGEFGGVGEAFTGQPVIAERHHHAVFDLDHFGRRIERQPFGMPAKIGDGDEQIERLAVGQQPRFARRGGHRVERVEDLAREKLAPEWRLEPARADEMRQLGADFLTRAGLDRRIDRVAPRRHPRERERPDLGKTMARRLFGVDQRFDIRRIEPQIGQRLEALSGADRLREEDAVDATGACARDNIDEDAQFEAGFGFDFLEQRAVYALAAAGGSAACVKRPTGAGEPPDFLGNAVHVDGQADPAIADECQPEFLLARHERFIIAAPAPPRSANDPTRAVRQGWHGRRSRARESRA